MSGWGDGWRNFDPAKRTSATKVPTDRGSRRGAKRCIVTDDMRLLDYDTAKSAGFRGAFFQSKHEAKRWISLNYLQAGGDSIRALKRQVAYPLTVRGKDGLVRAIGKYVADFTYEERVQTPSGPTWAFVVEDAKPSGGHREDLYLWKRKHFEAEYGFAIREC